MAKEKIKEGDAQEAVANRRGKIDLSMPVKLYIQGRNLVNMDTLSQSDPRVIVSELRQGSDDDWFEVGKTEVIMNTLNPDFRTAIDC